MRGEEGGARDRAVTALMQLLTAEEIAPIASRLDAADWEKIVLNAFRHGVAPLLHARLRGRSGAELIPDTARHALERCFLRTTLDNLRLFGQLAHLLSRLQARQIPVIVLKGAFLADAVYDERGCRWMSDIDLLVRREDFEAAEALLRAEGWHAAQSAVLKSGGHDSSSTKDGLQVDLHWNIEDDASPFHVDARGLWERARRVRIAGRDAMALAPEDLLLHLCLHAAYCHGWLPFSGGLRHLCDIAAVTRHYRKELDWAVVVERAQAWGIETCAWLALVLAEEMTHALVPRAALSRMRPHVQDADLVAVARRLIVGAHDVELTAALPVLARLWLTKAWRHKRVVDRVIDAVFPMPSSLDVAYPSLHAAVVTVPLRYAAHWADLVRDLAAIALAPAARALRERELQRWALIRSLERPARAMRSRSAITYREATPEDCAAVARVNVGSWRASFAHSRSADSLAAVSVDQRADLFRRRFGADFYRLFVAEMPEHGIVGFADVGEPRNREWDCDAELYAIYVLKEFQRRGIGRRLFDMVVEAAQREGRKSLYLIVLDDSPYRRFYEGLSGRLVADKRRVDGNEAHAIYAWRDLEAMALHLSGGDA